MEKHKVLIIDIERPGKELEAILETSFDVKFVKETEEGINLYQSNRHDFVFCNLTMPKVNGLDFLKRVREFDKDAKVYICSIFSSETIEKETKSLGGIGVIKKPYEKEEVLKNL